MQKLWLDKYFNGDRTIWLIVFLLSIFSLLAVYSSTGTLAYKEQGGNTEYYLFKHFIVVVAGLALMYLASMVNYKYYSRISQIALLITIPLLVFTLFLGSNKNDASRWLTLPVINLSFQTSDLAKLALIMYVARVLSKKQDKIEDFKEAFLPVMVPVLIVTGLILPANLSTALLLFVTCLILMIIGRLSMKYILMFCGAGVVCLTLFISIMMLANIEGRIGTWKSRIESYTSGSDGDSYQTQQAKIAVATGGLLGKSPGKSTTRNFLPHPYSDFIFAIIVEEYGFVGAAFVVFLYILLFFRVIRFVHYSPKAYGTLLAIGCSFSLVFQAMINMGVAVNILPVTGQPLPMLSMGGTSIWFTSLSIGIILSVSRQIEEDKLTGGKKIETAAA